MTSSPVLHPAAIANMCGDKQRHPSRAAAHVERAEKDRKSGRRHKVQGCGICCGFHVYVAATPASKRAHRRRGFVPAMGA